MINRLTASYGIDAAQSQETRKIYEENRQLKIEVEDQISQIRQLADQNRMKDQWLDEIMEKICDSRRYMAKQAEKSTRVCLQLEVQRF